MIRVKIAGHVFGLENKYDLVRFMCRDYLTDEEPEAVFESEVEMGEIPWDIVPAYQKYFKAMFPMTRCLLQYDTIWFHSSCLALDGRAILFTAPGGTGKSTHSRLWRERFGKSVTMINDDKPLLKFEADGAVTAYGSPWNGHHFIDTNTSAPLAAIVVLKQAPENSIRRLSQQEAFEAFCRESLIPDDFALRMKAIGMVGRLTQLPVFELACTPTQEAVTLSYKTLMSL